MSSLIENPIPWPSGCRCAVALTWDMDAESSLHLHNPDRADTLVATASFLRYGPKIAMKRLVTVYERFGIRQTFFLPGWCIERYPETVELLLENGHEIGLHGYLHERCNELSRDEEAYWLDRGLAAYRTHVGGAPRGWRAPTYTFSRASLDLLVGAGFDYDSSLMGDDQPHLIENDRGNLVELPTSWTLDDWPQYMHNEDFQFVMPIRAPHRGIEVFEAEFEAAWKHSGMWIAVWHPFLSGRLARVDAMIGLLERMQARGDVWFARLCDIAEHVRRTMEGGDWAPRRDRLPFDVSPIPELDPVPLDVPSGSP